MVVVEDKQYSKFSWKLLLHFMLEVSLLELRELNSTPGSYLY